MLGFLFETKTIHPGGRGSPRTRDYQPRVELVQIFYGEFDPGSERTLAAGLTHASRARKWLRPLVKRRTGE